MAINWHEVTVGETDTIKSTEGRIIEHVYKAANIQGDLVGWTKQQSESHFTFFPKEDWTIYDPWEEITEECEWVPVQNSVYDWIVWYRDEVIGHNDPCFRFNAPRVWKRKEG